MHGHLPHCFTQALLASLLVEPHPGALRWRGLHLWQSLSYTAVYRPFELSSPTTLSSQNALLHFICIRGLKTLPQIWHIQVLSPIPQTYRSTFDRDDTEAS